MSSGILEVVLVDAKNLMDTDAFGKIEPYVVIRYGNQERKSRVSRGSNPTWNESFMFNVECPKGANDQHKITFRIMDKDTFSADDFVGESIIYVKDVVSLGMEKGTAKLPPTKHRVVLENKRYYGEIQVGVAFISKCASATHQFEDENVQDIGGWKQSLHVI
ncbi:hypothetical protein AQUCO_02700380v1 [Aquilegia coerulea]|uniref:C2 domain-containing protein n=1 Tax=Aquilegia coerulea TaxID=218851 RepID=A0A2G5D6M8_AQUCA|nr:hypothetical protein AQUCO_02700380v1 [Aquilegia coerulea]